MGVFFIKNQNLTRSQSLDWDRFGLWAWPWEASYYGHPNQEALGVHCQGFGLWGLGLWRLHTMASQRL